MNADSPTVEIYIDSPGGCSRHDYWLAFVHGQLAEYPLEALLAILLV